MENIVIIIDKYSCSTAIWTAYKKHILDISKNFNVEILVDYNIYIDDLKSIENKVASINEYSNTLDLYKKILISKSRHIYLPHILLVTKLSPLTLFNKKIFLWLQGILPEESYLKNKSKLRLNILSRIEKFAIKVCSGVVVVSNSMIEHINKKYNVSIENHLLIPCLSDLKYRNEIEKKEMSFVYVGGASEWQKIDLIIHEFIKIKEKHPNANLDFISKDHKEINLKISNLEDKIKESIDIYSINNRENMSISLSQYQYGFLFRDNIAVNRVSSPIKFCEYLSCGIRPIISDNIGDYSSWVNKEKFGIVSDHSSIPKFDQVTITPLGLVEKYDLYSSSINTTDGFLQLLKN